MAVPGIKMQTGPPASSETKVKLYTPSSHNRNALSFFVRKKKTEIPDMLESWIMSDSVCTGETQSRFWDSSLAPTKKKKLLEQKLFNDKQGARSESREQAKVTKRKIDVQGGHWAAQGWYKKKRAKDDQFFFFS